MNNGIDVNTFTNNFIKINDVSEHVSFWISMPYLIFSMINDTKMYKKNG